nr:hypothetical protein [Gimesia maris]
MISSCLIINSFPQGALSDHGYSFFLESIRTCPVDGMCGALHSDASLLSEFAELGTCLDGESLLPPGTGSAGSGYRDLGPHSRMEASSQAHCAALGSWWFAGHELRGFCRGRLLCGTCFGIVHAKHELLSGFLLFCFNE